MHLDDWNESLKPFETQFLLNAFGPFLCNLIQSFCLENSTYQDENDYKQTNNKVPQSDSL